MVMIHMLKEMLLMAWEIFWPLALGFILSALIRAFIPMQAVTRRLGKTNAKGLALAALFGAISSSCSYAAASMSRTLVIKGASWSNAIGFMIASTNLVFEIFLVIVTLLGWAFFGGEIIGGLLLIIFGAILIGGLLTPSAVDEANVHIRETETAKDPPVHLAQKDMGEMKPEIPQRHVHVHASHEQHYPLAQKWKDAAGYFYMDVTMVGKDILIGIVIASILAVVVPHHFWETLFLKNESQLPSFLVVLGNTVIGMLVALFAFVCSVGNILLAAVLWHGGINFGGVVAFILADLITIPMLMVYRRYYGAKMMWRLLAILALSILLTGIGVDYIFRWAGWIPHDHGPRMPVQMEEIKWNYKTLLNLIFIPLSLLAFFWGKRQMKKAVMQHE